MLVIGPYQGGHGCLRIPFSRGICGAAARSRKTQLVPDVDERPEHIACSSSTRSEIVVPVISADGRLLGVLDVDSNVRAAFTEVDQQELEAICADLAGRFRTGERSSRAEDGPPDADRAAPLTDFVCPCWFDREYSRPPCSPRVRASASGWCRSCTRVRPKVGMPLGKTQSTRST